MRILFCHPVKGNYVSDGLFLGLRTILGNNCVDIPRCDIMYADLDEEKLKDTGNNGFYLYGRLTDTEPLKKARLVWQRELSKYDFFIIGNIWAQWEIFVEIALHVPSEKIIVIDGEDTWSYFPFDNVRHHAKSIEYHHLPALSTVQYFKRERDAAEKNPLKIPALFKRIGRRTLYNPRNIQNISMSLPEDVIEYVDWSEKTKDFVGYIVDSEVGEHLNGVVVSVLGDRNHVFLNEEDYSNDLRQSKFGITTKRGGWDCLRHYEYAAKGTILCFKSLDSKPHRCAPHDLDRNNCLIYQNYDDLMHQIEALSEIDFRNIQKNAYAWVWSKTTTNIAAQFLQKISGRLVSDFFTKTTPLSILR